MTDAVLNSRFLSGAVGACPNGAALPLAGPGTPLKVPSDLTIANVTAQKAALAGSISQGTGIALDLSEVHECDTAGLQLIYSLRRTVLERNRRWEIVAVSPEIQELTAALGLDIQELSAVSGPGAVDNDSRSRSGLGGL